MNGHDRASLWPVVVRSLLAAILFLALTRIGVAAQDTALQLDPQHTTINFTLGDVLHAVHGTFQRREGALRLSAASGKLAGKIVVDARSGDGGGGMRDRKMHKEVLQSHR
jgi:polyisoprenoid-binding protein YceI